MTSPWATLLSSGKKDFDSSLKDTALKENVVLAFEALNPYISAQPHHLPFIAAAGVLLLKTNHVTQLYLGNHFCLKELG